MRSPSALPTNATWIQGELAGKVDVTKKHKNVRSEPNKTFVWINSQIVASSQSGSTLQDLVRTIREYLNEMNLVNLTTAMHRLGKMVSHDAKAQGYLKQCHILPQLLKLIAEMLETTPAKSIQAQSLSNLLWALASIKVVDTEVILLVCHHSLSSIDRFKPYELSTLLWALAKLSTLDCNSGCKLEQLELIFDFARKPLRQYARSMECRCLSMVVWAYATVDKVDEELFAMVGALVANRPALTCQEMANIIWAFGSQHVFHGDLFESLAQKGVQTIKDFKAQDLSNMLCGFASVGFFHEDFFEQAARETLSKNVPSQYLANIIWAFAHVCPNHPLTKQFFLAIVPPCRLQLSTFKPQEVCIVALAVAKTFRCFEQSSQLPSVILHFFRTISHIRTSMADFSSQCLADMATAFAMVGLFDSSLLHKLGKEAVARAFVMEASDLFRIFQAFLSAQRVSEDCANIARLLVLPLANRVKTLEAQDLEALSHSCCDFLRDSNRQDLLEECGQILVQDEAFQSSRSISEISDNSSQDSGESSRMVYEKTRSLPTEICNASHLESECLQDLGNAWPSKGDILMAECNIDEKQSKPKRSKLFNRKLTTKPKVADAKRSIDDRAWGSPSKSHGAEHPPEMSKQPMYIVQQKTANNAINVSVKNTFLTLKHDGLEGISRRRRSV